MVTKHMNRRRVLRGVAGSAVFGVALPFLDCFLTSDGKALAATGQALPPVFGTWFQGLSFNPGRWKPEKVGKDYESKAELKVFDPYKSRMNLISGLRYFTDGRPVATHQTGIEIAMTGSIPVGTRWDASIDSLIADQIGTRTRFRSLEVSLNGSRGSLSRRAGQASANPSEPSPAALYTRIFGPEFADPNAATFTPDPRVMARKSVLSYVVEDWKSVTQQVGAADRARLDEYFTSLREIEQQLEIELQRPTPLPACTKPEAVPETEASSLVDHVSQNSRLFAKLLAHALACGQTRVFNVQVGAQGLRRPGSNQGWHSWTHEEPIDDRLGYQPEVTWFIEWANQEFAHFIRELDSAKEGDGTVLDRALILWQTDHGYARTHTMEDVPVITIGNANGRIKTGYHISAAGDPTTRAGLTIMQAYGVPLAKWGRLSNETSKTITEIL